MNSIHLSNDSYTKSNNGLSKYWSEILPFALIFLTACWIFFAALGQFPLFNPDEALYANPAAEMLETGNYITTTLNYAVRFTKPPLNIWMMTLCYRVFGVNEFAARFPGAACGTLLVAFTYLFIRKYAGKRAACMGSLSLMAAPLFVATSREAITDMPLSLFVASALMCFYHARHMGATKWLWIAYALLGLAVMTKGPVGAILPILILLVYHLLKRDIKQAISFYKPHIGLLITAVIAVPWFAVEIAVTKGAYFRDFILRENFQRFTSVVDAHKGAWWYHLAVMLGGYFPWSVFIPQALCRALGRYKNLSANADVMLFSACWALVTLLFFSVSVSKLIPYTVPAFPALAILIALELEYILCEKRYVRLIAPLAALSIIYGGAGVAMPVIFTKLRHIPAGLFKIIAAYISYESLVCLISAALALWRKPVAAIAVFSGLTLAASAFFGYHALEVLSNEWEGPIPVFARYIALSKDPFFVYKIRKPSVTFYAHRAAALSPNQENLTTTVEIQLNKLKNAYVIANANDQNYFSNLPHAKVLLKQGNFILVRWSQER